MDLTTEFNSYEVLTAAQAAHNATLVKRASEPSATAAPSAAAAASVPAATSEVAPPPAVAPPSIGTVRELNKLRDENKRIKGQLMSIVTILNDKGAKIPVDTGATITMIIDGISAYLTKHYSSSGGRYTPINIHKIKIKTKKHRQKSTRYTVRKQQI